MSQKNSLIICIIITAFSLILGIILGRYVFPNKDKVSVVDYNKEFYTIQIQKGLSTIDSLEQKIKLQESMVDSFLNQKKKIRIEYIIKKEEINRLPLNSSVIILRNFIEEYEKDRYYLDAISIDNN